MHKSAFALLVLTVLLVGCSRELVWNEYKSPDGFSVMLPEGKVDEQEQNESTPLGPIHLKLRIIDAGREGYGAGFMDVPAGLIEQVGTGKFFDLCLKGGVDNLEGGKLGKQEDFTQLG